MIDSVFLLTSLKDSMTMAFFYYYFACLTLTILKDLIFIWTMIWLYLIYLNMGQFTNIEFKNLFLHGHIFWILIYLFILNWWCYLLIGPQPKLLNGNSQFSLFEEKNAHTNNIKKSWPTTLHLFPKMDDLTNTSSKFMNIKCYFDVCSFILCSQ